MEIFSELNINKNLSLALGYFDGVHLGHRNVITSAVEFAQKHDTKSAVITFKDHPCCYFWGVCPKYILTRQARREKIEELGVDYLYELDFEKISNLTAEEYLKDILIKNFSPISISTGFNHNFGCKKSGNTTFLQEKAQEYNYEYFKIDETKLNNETISSTTIRKLLAEGELPKANSMLGYNFEIEGTVIEGQKLGRQIGFRTANIVYPGELIDLPFGAYATRCRVDGETYNSVTNFGVRPTISDKKICTVESHLLNFDRDIYGKTIKVEFLQMLRPEMKFNSIEELKKQIFTDLKHRDLRKS